MAVFGVGIVGNPDYFFSDRDGQPSSLDASGRITVTFNDLFANDNVIASLPGVSLDLDFPNLTLPSNTFSIVGPTITYNGGLNDFDALDYNIVDTISGTVLGSSTAYFAGATSRTVVSSSASGSDEREGIVAITTNSTASFFGRIETDGEVGTGFYVSEKSVLTAAHVLEGSFSNAQDDWFASGVSGGNAQGIFSNRIELENSNVLYAEIDGTTWDSTPRRSNDIALIDVGDTSNSVFGLQVYVDATANAHPLVTNNFSLTTSGYPGNRDFDTPNTFPGTGQRGVTMVTDTGVLTSALQDDSESGYILTSDGLDGSGGQSGSPVYLNFTNPLDQTVQTRAVGVATQATQITVLNTQTGEDEKFATYEETGVTPFTPESFVEMMRWIEARGDKQPASITNGITGNDGINRIPGSPWADVRVGQLGTDIFEGRPQDFDGDIFPDIEVGEFFQLEFEPGTLSTLALNAISVNNDDDPSTWDTVTIDVEGDGTSEATFQAKLPVGASIIIPDLNNAIQTVTSGSKAGTSYATFQVIDGQLGQGFTPNGISFVDVEEFVTATVLGQPETSIRGSELRNIAITDTGRVYSVAEIEAGENDIIGIPPIFIGSPELVLLEHDRNTGSVIDVMELVEQFRVPEAVRALAPLPNGDFFAVGEWFIGQFDRGQDVFFRVSPSGSTTFLGNVSTTGGGTIDNPALRIVSADTARDGTVYLWQDFIDGFGGGTLFQIDPSNGNELASWSFASPFEILSISFTPTTGELLATGGDSFGRASLFSIDTASSTITQLALFSGSNSFAQEFEATAERPADSTQIATPAGGVINGTAGKDVIFGGSGIDIIAAGAGADLITTGAGRDRVIGSIFDFAGDIITDFSASDTLSFLNISFGSPSIFLRFGSAILDIDADLDGTIDATVTLEGEFDPATTVFAAVDDGQGNTEVRLVSLNELPEAQDDTFSVSEGQSISFSAADLLNNDGDPDAADQLSISNVYTEGLQGALFQSVPGQFQYTANLPGDLAQGRLEFDSFAYTVSDGNGGFESATVTFEVSGRENLIANDDVFQTAPGSLLLLTADDLANNDTNPAVGDLEIFALITDFTEGLVSLNEFSELEYRAPIGFSGTDSFQYSVLNQIGDISAATVTVNVSAAPNQSPVVSAITAGFGEDATSRTVNLLDPAFVNDPDGDDLDVENVIVTAADGRLLSATTNPETGLFSLDDGQFEDLGAGVPLEVTINYDVTDGLASAASTTTLTITGANDAPSGLADSGVGFVTDEDTAFTTGSVLANDTDLDGDTLAITALDTTGTLGLVIDNGDGTFDYDPNGALETLSAGANTTDSFSYTVSDGNGGTDTAAVTVTVNGANDAAVVADDTYNTSFGAALNVTAVGGVLANDFDVEGDALNAILDTEVSNGTLVLNTNGSFDYTPNLGFSGADSFTYFANDGIDNSSAAATVTITVNAASNTAPIAGDDSFNTNEDVALSDSVLTNDSDGEGDPLTVSLLADVSNGTLLLNTDGTFDYTPNGDFDGFDSFSYSVSDGLLTDTGTVSITVDPVADNPIAVDDAYTTDEDTVIVIDDLNRNDFDPDGGSIFQIIALITSTGTISTLGSVVQNGFTAPDIYVLTYDPGSAFDSLKVGESTTDTFGYEILDPTGRSDTGLVTITINGVNDGPVASDDSDATAAVTPVDINVLGNDTDVDGDTVIVSLVGAAANGSTAINADGTIRYTPNTGFDGTDSFGYTVSDGNGGTDTATVSVTVSTAPNQPPVVSAITADFGEDATGRSANLLDPTFVDDPDGGDLDVENVVVTTADGRVLSATTDPETGLFLLDDGQFEDLAAGVPFDVTINYDVTDSTASVANTATVTITGANDDPVTTADSGAGFATDEDTAFTTDNVLANDTDVDGDTLSVSGLDTTGTLGLVINNGDGTFDYDPNGAFENLGVGDSTTDSFSYTVSDGNGGTDTETVTVEVSGTNDDPGLIELNGTSGRDRLIGTSADELIDGGSGSDTYFGQGGDDTFVFEADGTRDREVIRDFETGMDSILLDSDYSIRFTSRYAVITTDEDRDSIFVYGDATTEIDLAINMATDGFMF